MLNILLSRDWTAGRDEILRLVGEDVRKQRPGRVLMVPELISHDMERRLCSVAGDTSSRFAEVLSFTRLARRVADYAGTAVAQCLDNGGRVVAMAAAARQLHSRLKAYAAVETRPEFLTELVDAVDEFKRCCITSQDLMAAACQTQGSLAQKLEELSLILEAYDSLCQRGKRDPRDQMTWLLEQLEDSEFAQHHAFYIDGFPDFTRQHLAIIEHLIRCSASVTVSLTCDRVDSTLLAFEKAGDTAVQLIRCAKHAGIEVNIRYVGEVRSALSPVRNALFQGSLESRTELGDRLLLWNCESVYEECMAAAQRILTLVRQGCRYRDISVVCADAAAYQDTIRMVFRRCGIPLYQSGTEEILSKTVIQTVLSAMDAALGGFDQRDVLRYLKSPLSPVVISQCDLLENYAIVWGIRGVKWAAEWKNHPDGLNDQWSDEDRALLASLNAARQQAMTPLVHLRDAFRRAKTLSEQVQGLYRFFEEIQLDVRLRELADAMDDRQDNRGAQILNQLWEILLSALEQLHDVLGETVWDAETFTRLFTLLLSQYDVGTIPPVLDAVTVGPVSAMRCQQEKHLIVLGAEEGKLPGYGGAKGVLTDQERVALRELGVPLTGGNLEGLQAEFAEIYGVFCGADETIYVSYPSGQPSFVYRRLCQMAGGDQQARIAESACLTDPVDAAAYLASHQGQSAAEQLGLQGLVGDIASRAAHDLGTVSREQVLGLYGKKLNLSASQVDRQAECRLSYFLRYGLRLKERKEATVDPAEFGTYVHAVLEHTARRVMELGGFHSVSLEETLRLAKQYSDAYAQEHFSQLDSQRTAYLLQRNEQELWMIVRELWQELCHSLFEPLDFELAFGDGAPMPAIPIGGKLMDAQLRGYVDRVDGWNANGRNYFRVVDYKTGRKDFDYCDVFHGIGLQMLLYLFALEQGGDQLIGADPIPAGVQYFSARSLLLPSDGRLTDEEAELVRGKQWKRRGLLLRDEEVLGAMEPEGSPQRLNCKKRKDGSYDGDLADPQQLRQLKQYIFKLLGRMVDDIASGNIAPNPYTRGSAHNACTYCPYSAVCHAQTVEGRRNYKAMPPQRFWEEIGKEAEHG